ncbi:hypothetical protein RBI22_15205 [Alcaligenaceae bacterium C4P045]|nr:hypothetical protein [Alcaligenaceae bacterium C4P045]
MQPVAYNREKDFANDYPDETDGGAINRELDAAATSINETRTNLAKIQRDDGGLQRIVDRDTLTEEFDAELRQDVQGWVQPAVNEANQAAAAAGQSAAEADAAAGRAAESAQSAAQEYASAIRVPSNEIVSTMPPRALRARKLMAFDANGNPSVSVPESGSAADVLIQLAGDDGSGMVGFIRPEAGAAGRRIQDKLSDTVSIEDYDGAYDIALSRAMDTLEKARIPASISQISVSLAQSTSILARLNMVDADGPIDLAIAAGVHEINSSAPIAVIGQNHNVRLVGADPINASVLQVLGVAGVAGNWSVTYRLSAVGAQVGQVLQIKDMPGGITYFQAVPVRRVFDGELAVGFNRMGTITTSGTTCSLSRGTQEANLAIGDLVHIQGQTRVITDVPAAPAQTFQINAPLSKDVSGYQWWYYTSPAQGAISTTGRSVALVGVGTSFATKANAGDFILADGVMVEISAIASDTAITLVAAQSFAAGTPFTIVRGSILHEGSYAITAVNGDQVTVRSRSQVRPPVQGVVAGAAATILRTVLKQSGTGNGFEFMRGAVLREMTNIALVGPGNSVGCVGLAMNGAGQGYNQGTSLIVLGENSAVLEWGFGVNMSAVCALFAWKGHICNNLNAGLEAIDGAFWYLREAVVSHNRDINILSSGGYGRFSGARICGALLQGVRQDVGSGIYGDSVFIWGTGSHGVMGVNRSGIQCADGFIIKAGGNGINQQNGAGGRFSRMLIAGAAQHAIFSDGCHDVEITQGWLTGSRAGQSGAVSSHGAIKFGNGASTGHAAAGMYGLAGGQIYAENVVSTRNGTNGARSDEKAMIHATGSLLSGNVGADVAQQGGVVTTSDNPGGSYQIGALYSDNVMIAVNAVWSRKLGNASMQIDFWSGNSTTVAGTLRARSGTGGGTISLVSGTGVTVMQNTVLTGATGAAGDLTVSVTTDGVLYVENRGATARSWIDLLKSLVNL